MVAKIELGIEQPQAPRRNAIRRRRGPMVEYEVDEELIANIYTKLYKDFYNKAITSLIERYPSDELEKLKKLENVLCKPCSEGVAHVFEKYKDDLPRGCTIETLTHDMKPDVWSWGACLWRTWPSYLMSTIWRFCALQPSLC